MKRMEQSHAQAQLWATAYHEAGHAIAAIDLKVGLGRIGVSIVASENSNGGRFSGFAHVRKGFSGNPDMETTGAMRLKAENRTIVLFAGEAAQRRFRPSSVRNYHAHSDRKTAIDLMSYFVGSDRELKAYLAWLRIRAEQLMDNPGTWIRVEALAKALMERKRVSATEAKHIADTALTESIGRSAWTD